MQYGEVQHDHEEGATAPQCATALDLRADLRAVLSHNIPSRPGPYQPLHQRLLDAMR